ncbi:VOC family protein [Staphylococcus auricularis]|uniref:VOC family protein n=1 Tax=Staphylococcus auricularis TaxID=29379 RepID=UPI003EBF6749
MESIQYFNFQKSLAALNFYEKYLGATNIQRIGGDSDMFKYLPEAYQVDEDFTFHASFEIMGQTFFCSDTMKNKRTDNSGANVTFTFDYENETERKKAIDFFNQAVESGCEAAIPLGPTAWSKLYGLFNDPFGVTWMINAN